MALSNIACTGILTVNSVSLNTVAWDISDLTDLWFHYDVRGEDRILPGVNGVIPYRRRRAPTRHDLTIWIVGDVAANGTPFADPKIGMETNLATLDTNVIAPTNVGDGTRAASLAMPSGATRTASIHVLGLVKQQIHFNGTQSIMEATLQISIPAGKFV